MDRVRKSKEEAKILGASLRESRKSAQLTLKEVELELAINVGQLSRFERGEFKITSPNLQKYATFLQKVADSDSSQPELVRRFARLLSRSERHVAAARALVVALDALK